MEAELWYGTKRYRGLGRRRRSVAPPPSFTERAAGDDVVQDVIDAADHLRRAHPSYRNAAPLMAQDGGVRLFWSLMLDACAKSSGISIDDLIERIRAQALPDNQSED